MIISKKFLSGYYCVCGYQQYKFVVINKKFNKILVELVVRWDHEDIFPVIQICSDLCLILLPNKAELLHVV